MADLSSILAEARQLPLEVRLRLIDELLETVTPESEAPFSEAWLREIELRVAELDNGRATTIPWERVRAEALARLPGPARD